jgi:alpha-glucosidase
MGCYPDAVLLHVIVPEEEGEFLSQLHEDDGISDAHVDGHFLRTTFTLSRRGDRVKLVAQVGGKGFPEFRRTRFQLLFRGATVERVELDGHDVRAPGGRLDLANSGEAFELSFVV